MEGSGVKDEDVKKKHWAGTQLGCWASKFDEDSVLDDDPDVITSHDVRPLALSHRMLNVSLTRMCQVLLFLTDLTMQTQRAWTTSSCGEGTCRARKLFNTVTSLICPIACRHMPNSQKLAVTSKTEKLLSPDLAAKTFP